MSKRARLSDAVSLGDGDVLVGAYARRLARRRLWLIGFGLALIGLAVVIYRNLEPAGSAVDTRPVLARCVECGFEGPLRVPIAARGTFECPTCHARGARELWACRKCGERFLPPVTYETRVCPACDSSEVGSAALAPPEPAPPKVVESTP
jgi:Zn finger protein HypA/HybF involved in hydrogenase expression